MKKAYELAEELCKKFSKRVKGSGFMSTLLLKRIGSTMIAGEKTAKTMLNWTENFSEIYDSLTNEDEEYDSEADSRIKNLTQDEINLLMELVNILKNNHDTDPKYLKTREILMNGVEGSSGWLNKGCIIFSQYFDSANYIANLLRGETKAAYTITAHS